ncbi:unnamed protein product, partial [Ectocarpus fasciculatus]
LSVFFVLGGTPGVTCGLRTLPLILRLFTPPLTVVFDLFQSRPRIRGLRSLAASVRILHPSFWASSGHHSFASPFASTSLPVHPTPAATPRTFFLVFRALVWADSDIRVTRLRRNPYTAGTDRSYASDCRWGGRAGDRNGRRESADAWSGIHTTTTTATTAGTDPAASPGPSGSTAWDAVVTTPATTVLRCRNGHSYISPPPNIDAANAANTRAAGRANGRAARSTASRKAIGASGRGACA